MNITALYKQIYQHFDTLTPLPIDCGSMCGKLCCQNNDDEEVGMYLFPGEEHLFENKDGFRILESDFTYKKGKQAKLLLCTKPCKREERPLSCRIFPVVPYYKHGSKCKVILDPRAYAYCPLTHKSARDYINKTFAKEVLYAFLVLMKCNKEVEAFIASLSEILDEYKKFLKG